jgi:hypothetical protein
MLTPYDVYVLYLALKLHFTSPSYNYFKYGGKIKANVQSFNKRKDRYFFEHLSRKKQKTDLINYFVSNFIVSSDLSKMWVGELREKGDDNYIKWKSRIQSLRYLFAQDINTLIREDHIYETLVAKPNTHPKAVKYYLSGKISLETLVILNDITSFADKLESSLSHDPIFHIVLNKIRKYKSFFVYDKPSYVEEFKVKIFIK